MPHLSHSFLLALLALIFFDAMTLVNLLSRGWSWDLTAQQRHHLSAGSKTLLAELHHPVRLRLFFSQSQLAPYATLSSHGLAAKDLLDAMTRAGEGNIRVEWVEPELFSEEEELAQAAGLAPLPLPQGGQAWAGLEAVNPIGGQAIISQLLPERADYLEYDMMRLVASLGREAKPNLGVITNLPLDTGPGGLPAALAGEGQPFLIYRELAQHFSLRFLERDFAQVPESLDALLVAHPHQLTERAFYALDQYLMGGGRLALFLDPHSELSLLASGDGPVKGFSLRSDLPELLEAWGIAYRSDEVLLDRKLAQPIVLRQDAGQVQVPYFLWPAFRGGHINQNHPATSGLEWVNLASVGTIAPIGEAASRFLPLLTSSQDSALALFDDIAKAPHPGAITARFVADEETYSVAGLLQGPFASAYPSAPPQAEEPLPPFRASSPVEARLAVVADSDIFDDRFWADRQSYGANALITPFADNGALVLNLLDYLAGAPQLLALRARTRQPQSFTRVEALEEAALENWQEEISQLEAIIADQQAAQSASAEPLWQARRRLREIRLLLRQDIESLFFTLRAANLTAMPALAAGLALLVWFRRRAGRTQSGSAA